MQSLLKPPEILRKLSDSVSLMLSHNHQSRQMLLQIWHSCSLEIFLKLFIPLACPIYSDSVESLSLAGPTYLPYPNSTTLLPAWEIKHPMRSITEEIEMSTVSKVDPIFSLRESLKLSEIQFLHLLRFEKSTNAWSNLSNEIFYKKYSSIWSKKIH